MQPGTALHRRARRALGLVALLPLLTGLAGCGQKGDLYLPPEPSNATLIHSHQADTDS